MKKIIFSLITITLASLLLFGCSDNIASKNEKQEDTITIGLVQIASHPSLDLISKTIEQKIGEKLSSKNIKFINKNANGDTSSLPTIMQSFVNSNVDMIIPIATQSAQSAISATSEIPIIFAAVTTPIEAGLVENLNITDKNITGVSDAVPVEDIIDLAILVNPELKTFGFVYNSSEINSLTNIRTAKDYCNKKGINYKEVTINNTSEIQQGVLSLINGVDAFFTPTDNTVASSMAIYSQIAKEAGIPIYCGADSMVVDGGFATIGINYENLGTQVAEMAIRILNGTPISETPVETLSNYSNIINKKTAESLGIDISLINLENTLIVE